MQRCTVQKYRNLLAHAPERLHEEIGADYTDMIYAATPEDIAARRKAFIRKWQLKHRPRRRQPGESRPSIVCLCAIAAKPMAKRANDKCDRTTARGRFANVPACLIGVEASVGAHHFSVSLARWATMRG